MNPNKITSNLHPIFLCEKCAFKCNKKGDWFRHVSTAKHKNLINPNNFTSKNIKSFSCDCGKTYKHLSTLCSHKKKCINNYEIKDKDTLIIQLLKQNGDLQKSLIEMSKEKSVTNNTTNNNSNNKTFNLNFFLNETCKDALNIREFVSSIKVNIDDLEITGRKGYIEGITNIILKNLKGLEQYQRPIHCSDLKREVMYIKDEDTWIKECEEKPILTRAIKVIANENIKQINIQNM